VKEPTLRITLKYTTEVNIEGMIEVTGVQRKSKQILCHLREMRGFRN
jgi:hypothetical protein